MVKLYNLRYNKIMKKNILFLAPLFISPIICTSCIWKKENHSNDEKLDKFIKKFSNNLVLSKINASNETKNELIDFFHKNINNFLEYKFLTNSDDVLLNQENKKIFYYFGYSYGRYQQQYFYTKKMMEKYIKEKENLYRDSSIEIINLNEYQNSKEKLIKYLNEKILKDQYEKLSKFKYDNLIKQIMGDVDLNNLQKTSYDMYTSTVKNILVLFKFYSVTSKYNISYRLKYVNISDYNENSL